jgi:hypothetical protein
MREMRFVLDWEYQARQNYEMPQVNHAWLLSFDDVQPVC